MKKYENFCNALVNLKDIYDCQEPYNNIEMTGLVGLFEICFEQAWKAMKEILENNGFTEAQIGSPRQIIKTAYQAKMINDEDAWLSAMVSRNNVANAYNRDIAMDIIHSTKAIYYNLFMELKKEIEANWL